MTGFAGVPSTFALLLHRSELESTPLPVAALRHAGRRRDAGRADSGVAAHADRTCRST